MKNIIIASSFCSGNTTLAEKLEEKLPKNKSVTVYDVARYFMSMHSLEADNMTEEEIKQMQEYAIHSYSVCLKFYIERNVLAVLNNSHIEVLAYGEDVLDDKTLSQVNEELDKYKEHSITYVLPPTIPLEKDGLRHTSLEYRIEIYSKILKILKDKDIPFKLIASQTPEERMKEVLELHKDFMYE